MEQREPAQEPTAQQLTALQTVYDIFKRDGVWPSFLYIDTELDREYDIEFAEVARVIRTYLINFDPHRDPGSKVSLPVRGIAKCEGSQSDLELFMRMLGWLRRRRQEWRPTSTTEVERLILTSDEALSEWATEGFEPSEIELIKAHALALQEGLTQYSSNTPDSGQWQVEPAHDLRRRFGSVETIDDYIALVQAGPPQAVAVELPERQDLELSDEPATQPALPARRPEEGPYVFILMPFTQQWSGAVHEAISRSCAAVEVEEGVLSWERADDIAEPGRITDQIIASIHRADVIIADVTGNNPNVMFELGFAHALGTPIVILNQEIAAAPFDIKDWRQIQYSVNGLEKTEGELVNFLAAALERHEGGGAKSLSLADRLHALLEAGVVRRERVAADPDWGQVHMHSGLQHWREEVGAVLEEEVPWLVLWFHPMESPGIALRQPPSDDLKGQHLAEFDWSIDRLTDIEAMVRANASDGHPDGEEQTRKLLLLERALRLLQEIRLLSQQLPGGIPGRPGLMDPGVANERIRDCTRRAKQVLTEMVGDAEAEHLIASVSVDPAMLREGIDPEGAKTMALQSVALREAMSRDRSA